MNRTLVSRRGFSLIEISVVLGLLSIVALGAAMLFKQLVSAQKYTEQTSAASAADLVIRTLLSNRAACKNSLIGLPTDGAYHPIVLKDRNNATIETQLGSTLRLKSVRAKANVPLSTVSFVQVEAIFEKIGDSIGAPERAYNYYVNVVEDAGVVSSCFEAGETGEKFNLRGYERHNLPINGSPTTRTIRMQHASYDPLPAPAGVLKLTFLDTADAFSHQYEGPSIPIVANGNRIMISTRANGDVDETLPCHSPALSGVGHLIVRHGASQKEYMMGGWICGAASLQTMPPTMFDTVPGETYSLSFRARMNRTCTTPCPNVPNNYQSVELSVPEVYVYHYTQDVP